MKVSGLESRQAALSADPDVARAPIEAGERCHERHHNNAGGEHAVRTAALIALGDFLGALPPLQPESGL